MHFSSDLTKTIYNMGNNILLDCLIQAKSSFSKTQLLIGLQNWLNELLYLHCTRILTSQLLQPRRLNDKNNKGMKKEEEEKKNYVYNLSSWLILLWFIFCIHINTLQKISS